MPDTDEWTLDVRGVKSLAWEGESLIDWVGGQVRIDLSGEVQHAKVTYPYPFDAALSSPSGRFVVIYERLGSKALLLDQSRFARELNRNAYHADAYEYPIAFLVLPDGREAIAHCPQDECRIDIEIAETGECLTDSVPRTPTDVFHSRLLASPGGKWLLSAGWVWHPWSVVGRWSLEDILSNPAVLDDLPTPADIWDEVQSAVFLDDDRFAVAIGEKEPDRVAIIATSDMRVLQTHLPGFRAGTLVPIGPDHLLCLYEYPRLLSVVDGSVTAEWPHLKTGRQASSIIPDLELLPPFAKHPDLPMFAVADAEKITVIRLR